jgi:hypothetical protein
MSDRDPDDEIARRARAALDRSIEEIDPATRARLVAARRTALEGLDQPRRDFAGRGALATAAAFGAAGLVLAASWWLRKPAEPIALEGALDDVEILADGDDLELYDELEFYRWLDAEEPI